jgi:D-glycero-D-manno-heptose 1,7-bisphosphate phosphatase
MSSPNPDKPCRALFLDRDGVINVEKNYVHRIADFDFVAGIFEFCAAAQNLDFLLIIVTNQAGIGRGYYSESDFQRLTEWMVEQFRERGIRIDRVYHCPYHPTAGVGRYRRDSYDRKPNPGMLLNACADFGLDPSKCVLIGDKDSDIQAGHAAGIGHLLWCCQSAPGSVGSEPDAPLAVADLAEARDWLLQTFGGEPGNPSALRQRARG